VINFYRAKILKVGVRRTSMCNQLKTWRQCWTGASLVQLWSWWESERWSWP